MVCNVETELEKLQNRSIPYPHNASDYYCIVKPFAKPCGESIITIFHCPIQRRLRMLRGARHGLRRNPGSSLTGIFKLITEAPSRNPGALCLAVPRAGGRPRVERWQ